MRAGSSRHRASATILLSLAFAVSACGEDDSGALTDSAYQYCANEATAEELAAAATALNLQVGPDAFADGTRDAGDPVFVQACEYAYQARGRDLDPGPQGQPGVLDPSPTAPLGPHASGVEASPFPASPSP